jgi:hypothetical protein
MEIVKHERGIDQTTFAMYHDVTIRLTEDSIQDIGLHLEYKGALDLEREFTQIFGREVMERIIKPLIKKQAL